MAKLPKKWRKKPVARTRSGAARKAWKTRRRRYGPSGVQKNSQAKRRKVRWRRDKHGRYHEVYADTGRRTGRKRKPGSGAVFYSERRPRKNQIFGLPSWLVIGGVALGLFLLTRKAQAKTSPATAPGTNYLVQPTGGWGYPPLTPDTFSKWCQAAGGVQSGTSCMVSGKGVFNLVGGRLKTGDQWVMDDDI